MIDYIDDSAPIMAFEKINGRYIVPNADNDVVLSKSTDSSVCKQQLTTVKGSPGI